MSPSQGIRFEEIRTNPVDLLHEIADPMMQSGIPLPSATAQALRRQQVSRLEENIGLLRRKQEEFNRRMEEYIQNIRALIGSLLRSMAAEARETESESSQDLHGLEGTRVRCMSCGEEKIFQGMRVILAKDSLESIECPTELIVEDSGTIKKGIFSCPHCGDENLLIRKMGS